MRPRLRFSTFCCSKVFQTVWKTQILADFCRLDVTATDEQPQEKLRRRRTETETEAETETKYICYGEC